MPHAVLAGLLERLAHGRIPRDHHRAARNRGQRLCQANSRLARLKRHERRPPRRGEARRRSGAARARAWGRGG
eukprot:9179072-Pyramimonas_sp.AAC.1